MRLLACVLSLLVSQARADVGACLEARDETCLRDAITQTVSATVGQDGGYSASVLAQHAISLRLWDIIPDLLTPFIGTDLDRDRGLVNAYGYGNDIDGLIAFAAAIDQTDAVQSAVVNIALRRALSGDTNGALDALQIAGSTDDNVMFVLTDQVVLAANFDQAYALMATLGPEAQVAALHRIAWAAMTQGDEGEQKRVLAALRAIPQSVPPRDRPGILDLELLDDPEDWIMQFEQSAMPEIADDPDYMAIHAIIEALLLTSLGRAAEAEAILSPTLTALSKRIETNVLEIDEVLFQLSVAAYELGQIETADRIFALRDDGGFVFQNFHFRFISDAAVAHFIDTARQQIQRMVADHQNGVRSADYIDWKLEEEGLLSDLLSLCEAYIQIGQTDKAAQLHDWAEGALRRYDIEIYNETHPVDLLRPVCFPDDFESEAANGTTYAALDRAIGAGRLDIASQILVAMGDAGAVPLLLERAAMGDRALIGPLIPTYLDQLRRYEDGIRKAYPLQADAVARSALRLRILFDLDGAGSDYARLETDLARTLALMSALWALDPQPHYFAPIEEGGGPWFFSKVTLIPAFYED